MSNLQSFNAKICITAAGWLYHEGKVLLVHHKKLNIWLAPGGHVEQNECPHQAAEREFMEETGVKVKAVNNSLIKSLEDSDSEFLPNPVISNLHWVCKANYDVRHGKADASTVPEGWRKKGCEQHVVFAYIVKAVDGMKFKHDKEETLGIGWFSLNEIQNLQTTKDIKREATAVFELFKTTA